MAGSGVGDEVGEAVKVGLGIGVGLSVGRGTGVTVGRGVGVCSDGATGWTVDVGVWVGSSKSAAAALFVGVEVTVANDLSGVGVLSGRGPHALSNKTTVINSAEVHFFSPTMRAGLGPVR